MYICSHGSRSDGLLMCFNSDKCHWYCHIHVCNSGYVGRRLTEVRCV